MTDVCKGLFPAYTDGIMPAWSNCPQCGKSLLEYGLSFECAHYLEISISPDGMPQVKPDRDLAEGTYYCGSCGAEMLAEDIVEIDEAVWD